MRAYAALHKLRNPTRKHRTPNWPRTAAWNTARRHWLAGHPHCEVGGQTCGNDVHAHDVRPWSTLDALERNSYAFLYSNLRTLCRRHHRALHYHPET
jgi:hypothetical protein